MKHTPAPWTYERGFRDVWNSTTETHSTAPDDFLTVCLYPDTETAPEISDNLAEVHGPNQEANARLIAAAPRTLTALEELYNKAETILNHHVETTEHTKEARLDLRKALSEAHNAIAESVLLW